MPRGLKLTASNAVIDFQIEISAQTDIGALFEWVSHNGGGIKKAPQGDSATDLDYTAVKVAKRRNRRRSMPLYLLAMHRC
ncbi:Hypothetical protein GSB_154060 [Giardia duodenalis]|uniref:Uncharacterized protein n=1 Tax=Giardia intestinalis TaxID=5741 RepID=V6TXT7_GIAIN|nr:Hypothetical protein GSB_154060 [Giardia intestinalis]